MSVETVAEPGALLQLASFFVDQEEYGVDIALIQEIVRMAEITRVPRSPEFVEGVVNLRGKIVPVIDLRRRFGFAPAEHTKQTRIIIVSVAQRTLGLIVDGVSEVLRLAADAIDPTPDMVRSGGDSSFLKGVGKREDRLLLLLDLGRLLGRDELESLSAL
ncbi:MAG TPA: chemotaxis protein CheW [Pantanalinema sp.]